ncbi:HET-domain-containing protein [Cubamyces sp. BRFM 1775]|nr:HET-domain-containing protein [Cubamyces sp. BRFM 1775]
MAKASIEECACDHTTCRAITLDPAPLPRRLLDCSDPHRVHIIETDGKARGRYIVLSYVWGGPQPHRTTTSNLSSYIRDGIDSVLLPQTIQDAIHVARALSIPLLWFDSLCIIQDSAEDKHRELASMRNVYRHAYITIDVSRATGVTQGFLQDCRAIESEVALPFICPSNLRGSRTRVTGSEVPIGKVYLAGSKSHSADTIPTDGGRLQRASETGQRGWCLQETLLSARSLIFTSETLQLRCQTRTQNVGGAAHDGQYDLSRLPDVILLPVRQIERGSDGWREIHRRWYRIVEDYSSRSLTEPTDKLVACAAIAEMFAPFLGPDYIAGLWRHTLIRDLLWFGTGGDGPPQDPQQDDHPPSWLWASYDGRVQYSSCASASESVVRPLAEVLACTVEPQDDQLPYGPATPGGVLVLRALLCPCRCYCDHTGALRDLRVEVEIST